MKNKTFKTASADKYLNKITNQYEFPFEVLDKTPGGSNLGRIEWCIELIRSKRKKEGLYYIEKLYLWAKQTRDKRYIGKIFEIPCYADCVGGPSRESFLKGVWRVGFCDIHKTLILEAYPDKDNYKKLVINNGSSILMDIYFE
jgi:hypothetical protein